MIAYPARKTVLLMKKLFQRLLLFQFLFAFVLFSQTIKVEIYQGDLSAQTTFSDSIQQEFVIASSGSKIECFYQRPSGIGPFPVVFVIHGHQPDGNNRGGRQVVDLGYLNLLAEEGIFGVAISLPGYGQSEGQRDYCGPDSQQAALSVIQHFKSLPFIDSLRMGLYGFSRGAILGSLVSCQCSDIFLQILEGGWYDFTADRGLPCYLKELTENILRETGGTPEALRERSALFQADKFHAKTLFLHGEFDDRKGLSSARQLHERLIARNVESYLKVFPNELHFVESQKWATILPFLRAHFFNLYGIGINISMSMPVFQISKIHSESPAERSQKLKVGDAILRISPFNTEEEVDVVGMRFRPILSLLLGEKGSFLRLHVQHFDGTLEDVVVQRNWPSPEAF
jgi:pimeloyl-ACP methyl ester carboxylesterase